MRIVVIYGDEIAVQQEVKAIWAYVEHDRHILAETGYANDYKQVDEFLKSYDFVEAPSQQYYEGVEFELHTTLGELNTIIKENLGQVK